MQSAVRSYANTLSRRLEFLGPTRLQQHRLAAPSPTAGAALPAAASLLHSMRGHKLHSGPDKTMATSSTASTAATSTSSATKPKISGPVSNFCRVCGTALQVRVPPGEDKERHVCGGCGYVDYFNPKMVVGCIVEHQGQVLLCRRAIEPCKGMWTLPAGYLELNEGTAEGAARETREEAGCEVCVLAPYSHLDIPVIGQTYILFRAQLAPPFTIDPGPETLEARLFAPQDIPFEELAFSSMAITLRHYCADLQAGAFHLHHGVIQKQPGSSPSDPSYVLQDHFAIPTSLAPAAATPHD